MKIELKIPNKEPRKFSFRFDYNAIAEYEEKFNIEFSKLKIRGTSTARNIAYIGFKEADPDFDLDLKDVGRAMNPDTMVEIIEAWTKDMSTITGGEAEEVKK